MPGLTLVMSGDGFHYPNICRYQSLLLHRPEYLMHSVVAQPGLHLGWVAYPEYPAQTFAEPNYLIYFEGRIYNHPMALAVADLKAIANSAFDAASTDDLIDQFIHAYEGSFLAAIVQPGTMEVLLFSDAFCRLPIYYEATDSVLIVSREAKFIHALQKAPAFDRVGCAEFLAFGLPLGDRTVLRGVKSFPGAGLLRAKGISGKIHSRLKTLLDWNLDEEDTRYSRSRQAKDFSDLFMEASRNWGTHPDSSGNVVSLSGGHDSRAVLAGLAKSEVKAIAVTYRDPNGMRENEIRYAGELARRLSAEWHCIDLTSPESSEYENLAWLKDGMNWDSMAFSLGYLRAVVNGWGPRITYLSGDGGDDCLKVTAPFMEFGRLEDILGYIMAKETCVPASIAEGILKIPPGTLYGELRQLLDTYPEQQVGRRIKHFKIMERGRRCYFEGEDRARFFLWQDSPFYSLRLFRFAMRVPDRIKRYNLFCREALSALSSEAAAAGVTPNGYPPVSWRYLAYHWARDVAQLLPPSVSRVIRRFGGTNPDSRYAIPGPFGDYLYTQFQSNSPLTELLDLDETMAGLREMDEHSFFCFWTVVMLEKAYRSRMPVWFQSYGNAVPESDDRFYASSRICR